MSDHNSSSRSREKWRHNRGREESGEERKLSKYEDKKRRKRSRTKSISSDSSYDEIKFDKILDKKRIQKIREEKEEKRSLKEFETPDEKRARRIAKKLQKEEHRRAEAQVNAFPEGIPYTDLNNPFNDTSLTETFIWKKKWETAGKGDISRKKVEKINRDTIAKNYAEMEQLKRNRETREAVREDMEMIARDQDRRLCDWNRTEDVFHIKQAKLRSAIRIKEGRAKAIDYLGRYIAYMDESNAEEGFEFNNPLSYFPEDSIDDYEDLIADIKIYRVIDGGTNKNYWDDVEIVAKSELKQLLENRRRSMDSGVVHSSVQDEVLRIFRGKSYTELQQLEEQIQGKIKNVSKGTDVSYWESLSEQLRPFMAKQRLKELHTKMQQIRLKRIRDEQRKEMQKEDEQEQPKMEDEEDKPTTSAAKLELESKIKSKETIKSPIKEDKSKPNIAGEQPQIGLPFKIGEMLKMEDEQREQAYQLLESRNLLKQLALNIYEHGQYSPAYGRENDAMPGIEILDEEYDRQKLKELRKENSKDGTGKEECSAKEDKMMDIAKKGMTNDEAVFAVEETVEKQNFLWSDKYRPRKPRYFNRVHTGYDWNKYNQTHYDIDNPPPKIVQGYRFNIFYADLLDPSQTPAFTLTRCEDPDFAILRFRAGPPYEDIAFKIVNREWEVSYKHGYKCQFQNGVFQLWFFFKRYRYRR